MTSRASHFSSRKGLCGEPPIYNLGKAKRGALYKVLLQIMNL